MSIVEMITKAEENSKWLSENYGRLAERYNDRWVAVLDRDVIDYDKELRRLTARLRRRLKRRYSETAIEYVSKKPINMVLVV
ncbi:MAG: hypothetical protein HY619_07745 [Thaumarchaeota archaeon]|nr:hypothetical protein [Nitrososphaerota archaeon]